MCQPWCSNFLFAIWLGISLRNPLGTWDPRAPYHSDTSRDSGMEVVWEQHGKWGSLPGMSLEFFSILCSQQFKVWKMFSSSWLLRNVHHWPHRAHKYLGLCNRIEKHIAPVKLACSWICLFDAWKKFQKVSFQMVVWWWFSMVTSKKITLNFNPRVYPTIWTFSSRWWKRPKFSGFLKHRDINMNVNMMSTCTKRVKPTIVFFLLTQMLYVWNIHLHLAQIYHTTNVGRDIPYMVGPCQLKMVLYLL